jgi:hypothetical protein
MVIDVAKALEKARLFAEQNAIRPNFCTGDKRTYESHRLASENANYRMKHAHFRAKALRAYFCKECNGWHLASDHKSTK